MTDNLPALTGPITRHVIEPTAIEAPDDLIEIELVPVEVFGTEGCFEDDCAHCKEHRGYGLSDAVQAWSDCNRADGRIYRVEESRDYHGTPQPIPNPHRVPGDTIGVYIRRRDLPWLQKRHGDRHGDRHQQTTPTAEGQ